MSPFIYALVLGLLSCSGWHLEPGIGAARWESGPNDVRSDGLLLDVRLKKDPVVNVEAPIVNIAPAPVTVVTPSGVDLAVTTHGPQDPDVEDNVDKALEAGDTIDSWGWDTKALLGALGLALLGAGAWLISKDKMPFVKKAAKKGPKSG